MWTLFSLRPLQKTDRQSGSTVTKAEMRLQNTKKMLTSKAITTFNHSQLKPLMCMASPPPLIWAASQRNLLMCLVAPGNNSGFTSTCPWLWSEGTLPIYWPVCKFDLILVVLSVLTNKYYCPPPAFVVYFNLYLLPSKSSFFLGFHCSLVQFHCFLVPCSLFNGLVSHTTYDDATASAATRVILINIRLLPFSTSDNFRFLHHSLR